MPYGPGKFEGESASTFLIYRTLLDGADDDAGNHALLRGFLIPGNDAIDAAKAVGYTPQEIKDSLVNLYNMAGAIMFETEQGFVEATIHHSLEELEKDWREVLRV